MDLSLTELVVLAASSGTPKKRSDLAKAAAQLCQSAKYDQNLALADIKSLETQRLLQQNRSGALELTREGWASVLHAIPVLESLRAAVAGVGYRSVRP